MDLLRALWFRVKIAFRRQHLDADMAEEMRLHLERRTQEKIADGLAPEEARYAAQREFGGVAQMQEQCRDERRFLWLEQSAQDLRYAFRQLRRNPGFAVTAIAILALGIGFNTAIFSVAYGVLWRPLPYPDPERLVLLQTSQQTEKGPRLFASWAPASFEALRERATAFESLAAYSSATAQLSGHGEPRQLSAVNVSPNFFAMLDIAPAQGRAFFTGAAVADDDRSVVVSDRLWRTALQSDPAIVGRFLTVDGVARTVVGVLPADFTFRPVTPMGPQAETDVFLASRWPGDAGTSAFLFLLGRVKPGISREQVDAELTTLVNGSSIVPPGAMSAAGAIDPRVRILARTVGLQEYGTGSARTLLLILLGAVALVLAIACVNVANLQMARLSARRGELSVRMALGAGRRRIVRQLLTEAAVLSFLGTALGVLLAYVALQVTLPLVPPAALPRLGSIEIDARVIAFCLGLSCFSTLLVGLMPALRFGGVGFGEGMASSAGAARAAGDRHGERLRTLLVAAQIALTLVLLVGAGLLIHSFVRLTGVSPGFEASGHDGVVQIVRVTLPAHLYDKTERIQAFERGVLERTQQLPGVKSASAINSAPFGRMFIRGDFTLEGHPKSSFSAGRPKIDADYFKTMGIPLVAGREFTARDSAAAPKVAIVSERIAREYFPGGPGEALGRRVRLDDADEWLTVVGVVAEIRQRGLDQEVQPMVYVPFQQEREAFILRFVSFVARTASPLGVVEGIRTEIRRAAPELPIESTVTMDEAVAASVAAPRFRMLLLVLFAIAATLIATCGIYGLMAYAVTQRRRELGVRMALGASRGDVVRLVLGKALRIVAVGVLVGLVGAAAVSQVLQRFLFGVTSTDPLVFALVPLVLLTAALLAAWLPARRAAKVDPMVALRCE